MQDEVEENAELLKKQKGFGGDFFRAYYYNWASQWGSPNILQECYCW